LEDDRFLISGITQFYCSNCGNDKFVIPQNPKPDDNVICKKCNACASYKSIKEHIDKKTKKCFENIFSDFFDSSFTTNKEKKGRDQKNKKKKV
jgi:hypothetical protein